MSIVRPALLALLALAAPLTAAAQVRQQGEDVVVNSAAARAEIERILNEDSRTSSQPTPREVVERMVVIARGRAPQDFWSAYQLHVQAWARYAGLVEQSGRSTQGDPSFGLDGDAAEAQQAITTTFQEVERIARRYGARLPTPPVNPLEIA